ERRLSHQSAENIHKHSHTLSLSLSLSFSFGYLCLRCSHQSLTSRGRPDHHTPVNSPGSRPGYTHTHTHTPNRTNNKQTNKKTRKQNKPKGFLSSLLDICARHRDRKSVV